MSRYIRHYRPPVIRTEGFLHLHGKDINSTPICVFPDTPQMRKFHVPKKSGERPWALVDGKGNVIDQYQPRRQQRTNQRPKAPPPGYVAWNPPALAH